MHAWLCLILSLPTDNATLRMRTWRALKAAGAAVLRDGVYLLPEREDCRQTLQGLSAELLEQGGSAWLLAVDEPHDATGAGWPALFDRSADYAELLAELDRLGDGLNDASDAATAAATTTTETFKALRRLRKAFERTAAIDFFPGPAQHQAQASLSALEQRCARLLSPDEPQAADAPIERLNPADFQGRTWATRRRPWVDRLACAWLIRRFIDPQARLLWLASPADCPADALGFDFDGARFSHVGQAVSFEVLVASFGLTLPGLSRLGRLVHSLDQPPVATVATGVNGLKRPPEAAGLEAVLAGLRQALSDDDALLAAAAAVLDGLLSHFSAPADIDPPQRPQPADRPLA